MKIVTERISLVELKPMAEKMFGYLVKAVTEQFIVFDSMINMRPSWGNKSRSVQNPLVQEKIRTLVNMLVQP